MKHFYVLTLFSLLLAGCTEEVDIHDYIDVNYPLKMTIGAMTSNDNSLAVSMTSKIDVDSEIYEMLRSWADNNMGGWEATSAPVRADVCIKQGDFRLLYCPGSDVVVVGVIGADHKVRQFQKKILKGELDFLVQ